jgi:hypothetical protein
VHLVDHQIAERSMLEQRPALLPSGQERLQHGVWFAEQDVRRPLAHLLPVVADFSCSAAANGWR